jgi:predicted kinase
MAPLRCSIRRAGERMELVVFVGLPGSGKSGYFKSRYAGTHVHVSKDLYPRHADRKSERQLREIEQALAAGSSVVVDNTNPRRSDRAPLIAAARRAGARTVAVQFLASVGEAIRRNAARQGHARVPNVAIYTVAKRLEPPLPEEGFDEIVRVRLGEAGFEREPPPA